MCFHAPLLEIVEIYLPHKARAEVTALPRIALAVVGIDLEILFACAWLGPNPLRRATDKYECAASG